MKDEGRKHFRLSLLRIGLFALGGAVFGLVWGHLLGFRWQSTDGQPILAPILIGALNCSFIAVLTKDVKIRFRFFVFLLFGLGAGMMLGAFFGGMIGTILSIPFEELWEPLFLFGNFIGAIVIGTLLPAILIQRFQ